MLALLKRDTENMYIHVRCSDFFHWWMTTRAPIQSNMIETSVIFKVLIKLVHVTNLIGHDCTFQVPLPGSRVSGAQSPASMLGIGKPTSAMSALISAIYSQVSGSTSTELCALELRLPPVTGTYLGG